MEDSFGGKVSYRYRIDPATGQTSPLAVWSRDAIKDRILEAEITTDIAPSEASSEEVAP